MGTAFAKVAGDFNVTNPVGHSSSHVVDLFAVLGDTNLPLSNIFCLISPDFPHILPVEHSQSSLLGFLTFIENVLC